MPSDSPEPTETDDFPESGQRVSSATASPGSAESPDHSNAPVAVIPSNATEMPVSESADTPEAASGTREYARALALAVGLFVVGFGVGRVLTRLAEAVAGVGESGTVPALLVSVASLQVLGFGGVVVAYLVARETDWRSYLRVGEFTDWTATYGAFVGLVMMSLASVATVLFRLLELQQAESATAAPTDPAFYVLLFVISSFVAVPLEELFFRGLLQRRLEESVHPAVAVAVASLLFVFIHTGPAVTTGAELLTAGLFLSLGVALGVSYHLTENLLVPITGHVIFNGAQIAVRIAELLV